MRYYKIFLFDKDFLLQLIFWCMYVVAKVHYDDQMKIESVKTPGQYLHASQRPLVHSGICINKNQYEISLYIQSFTEYFLFFLAMN